MVAPMKVLIACEESQMVCAAFRAVGIEAWSCDIQPTRGNPDWHIQGDAIEVVHGQSWDLMIAHPPCTYLSNAGARHLYRGGVLQQARYEQGMAAKEFFMKLLNANIPRIAVENPVPTRVFRLPPYTQIIQPFQFGDPWQKKTCLWLKGLPRLRPSCIVEPLQSTKVAGNWYNKGGGEERRRNRSTTFKGIAEAMARQWGLGEAVTGYTHLPLWAEQK